jgi:hypothetical protein
VQAKQVNVNKIRAYVSFTSPRFRLFPGDGYVGINLYSRSPPHSEQGRENLKEMMESIDDLGLTWATEDWGFYWPYHYGFFIVPHGEHCVYDDAPKYLDGMGEWVFV